MINGPSIIALVDSSNDLIDLGLNPDVVQLGSILLPSFNAMNAYLDNDMNGFYNYYKAQLMSRECDEFMSLIIYALYRGKSILIYTGKESKDIPYMNMIISNLNQLYGCIIDPSTCQGQLCQSYLSVWISKFYEYDYIDYEEFLSSYPPGVNIDGDVLNKLIREYPYQCDIDPRVNVYNQYNQYFINEINARHGIYRRLFTIGGDKK